MIKDKLVNAETYYGLSERLKKGFEWLKSVNLKNINDGKYLIDGEDIYASNLEGQALVVMGNESNGISGAVRNEISRGLRIPSFGKSGAESLNVAVATAVTLSEFRRRQ